MTLKEGQVLIDKLRGRDDKAETQALAGEEWQERYSLEAQLEEIYTYEEIRWQRRGGETWLLKGDSNTSYFHGIANGRKRKCQIAALEDGERIITDHKEIKKHVEDYYKELFGKEDRGAIELNPDIWKDRGKLTENDRQILEATFTMEEVEKTVQKMKPNTAPGPDGFPVGFYKEFWEQVKYPLKEMMDRPFDGERNLSRLNYGLITLIPKLKEANDIKQFRPICLLNVSYKIVTKILANRLTRVADRVINTAQTTFIPGRNILEGLVILYATIHELQRSKKEGIILKLEFVKAYDKVQ